MIKTILSTELPVNERYLIRKNVISHGDGERRICIVTGTHGDELEGQMVCFLMAHRLQEQLELLDGTVEIYPALNPLGIDTIQRGIPNFDLDMNRIFPGNKNGTMAEQAAYTIIEDLKGADLVIDATPLGMNEGDPTPFDTRCLSPGQTVFDVVYGHGETALLRAAREAGCAAYDGSGMLVAQAVETVRDLAAITGVFSIPAHMDLFAIMAGAAGFGV